ncbi:hypothetical protein [Massilia frigida]|nr:hypothetical protein [Massilia frigida]
MRMLTALALSLAVLAPATHGAPLAASHPILGIWKLTLPDGSCSETYRFRGDGTTLVISAAEVSESTFDIPAKPSAAGFYKLVDKNVKVNGKPDCSGKVMKTGATGTNFIRFHPSGFLFVMCAAESFDACIGPFRRVAGKGV